MRNLYNKILVRKIRNIGTGTILPRAIKYCSNYNLTHAVDTRGRGLNNEGNPRLAMGGTVMVIPNGMSFENKLPTRSVNNIIITKKNDLNLNQCLSMSRHEIARAVQNIQEAPPTNELAELQAFIEAQNTAGIRILVGKICLNLILGYTFLHIGTEDTSRQSNGATNQITATTATENPGYTTQSEMVLREPVQYQYIYDPINDIMKRVEKALDKATDVGERKQAKASSTGKRKHKKVKSSKNRPNQKYNCAIAGTQSHVAGLPPTSTSICSRNNSSSKPVQNYTQTTAQPPITSDSVQDNSPSFFLPTSAVNNDEVENDMNHECSDQEAQEAQL